MVANGEGSVAELHATAVDKQSDFYLTSRHQQASDTTKCSPERQKYSVTN